jgi:hypothetical protein
MTIGRWRVNFPSMHPMPVEVTTTSHPARDARLSPLWAFVVELREGTSFEASRMHGRIEHVSSGQACLFSSMEQARSFMEAVMAAAASSPPATPEPPEERR